MKKKETRIAFDNSVLKLFTPTVAAIIIASTIVEALPEAKMFR